MALAMSIYRTLCVLVWSASARKILTIHRPSVRNNYNDDTQKIRKSQFVLSLPWFLHFSLSILLRSAFGIIMIKGISHLSWRSSKVTLVKTNWTPHPTRPLWTKSPCFLFVNKICETCLLFKTALLSQMKIDSWFLNLQPTSPCLEFNFVIFFFSLIF